MKMFHWYRRSVNPPYVIKDLPVIIVTFLLLVGIPLIVFSTLQRQDTRQLAAVTSSQNVIFVNSSNVPVTQTDSPNVRVSLTSPWPNVLTYVPEENGMENVLADATTTLQVRAGTDDVYQDRSSFNAQATAMPIGGNSFAYNGFRFQNVQIPRNATITKASLQVRSNQTQWISMRFAIAGDNTGNSQAFTVTNRPSQRALTSQVVNHSSNVRWQSGGWYDIGDVRSILQTIVNKSDWSSGNNVSLILRGTGGEFGRKFISTYNSGAANAPKLLVAYTTNPAVGATATPTKIATTTPTKIPSLTATRTPTPTPVLVTETVTLAEDAAFSANVKTVSYTSTPTVSSYTFQNKTPGVKTLYARFRASNGEVRVFSSSINLVSNATLTPTPTTPPTGGGGGNSHAMSRWSPNPKYDTCTVAQHDAYKVQGPDGKWYPTWHPPVDPGTGCRFGHEHGRDPSGSELLTFLKQQYGYDANGNGTVDGAELATAGVPFGYVNEQLDVWNASKGITNGMRHEDHVGHKIEWENNVQRDWSTNIGGGSSGQRTPSGIFCDFFMKIHQGTHSKDAFTNNMHELIQGYECTDGTKMANAQMLLFGRPGGFTAGRNAGSTPHFEPVGEATPPNSPSSGSNVIGRAIGDVDAVVDHILVPQGSWSLFSNGIYEDWISGNYVRTPNGNWIAYYDPHFAVFGPSRFYWPGSDSNTYGITRTAQDKADNVGRSVDVCFMRESNGERSRGGECDLFTNYGQITTQIPYDDPRSPFNGVKREFYFNNMGVQNTGSTIVWYADPFGNNAQTAPFTGSVKHYLKPKNGSTPHPYPFESNAIGSNRNYGGSGVHAPN